MKRRLDHLENINDNEPQNKRQKISNNDSNCKYWKLKNSYTENGYWSIFKLYVSTDLDRIGVVLFRKTNKTFKIIVIETDNEIWRLEGKIASPYLISFDDKLNICIKAYQSLNDKKIIVYNITNIQSKPKTISIKNGKFSDPNISLVKILNNKITLITQRGMLYQRYINEFDTKKNDQDYQYRIIYNNINIINDHDSKYIILGKYERKGNTITIYDDNNNTTYNIKHQLETLKTANFTSLIANKDLNRIVLQSNNKMYCLQINKQNKSQNINFEHHNNGAVSFDININDDFTPKTMGYQSNFVFESKILTHFKLDCFYDNDIFIGHNKNQLIFWRMCNTEETKKVLNRSQSIFDGDGFICDIIGEYVYEIPQKFVVKFIDCNKVQLEIEGINAKCGFIMLNNYQDDESFVFQLDYSLILNLKNKSQCLHFFTVSLPNK
eukprot:273227_1